MKTFNGYIEFVKKTSKKIDLPKIKLLVRKIKFESGADSEPGYKVELDVPLYPTQGNQCLVVDIDAECLVKLMKERGFKLLKKGMRNRSKWDSKDESPRESYDMLYGERGIYARIYKDPATIYFAKMKKEIDKNLVGLRTESLEVKLLGRRVFPEDESKVIASMPILSYATLHPSYATTKECENVVIRLLEEIVQRRINGFYGELKSAIGVLNQVK